MSVRMWSGRLPPLLVVGVYDGTPSRQSVWWLLTRFNTNMPKGPANPLVGIYTPGAHARVPTRTCTLVCESSQQLVSR